jgi:ABC-2 type transport system permease protein
MVREKENGTIVQVYASGISANEFLLGKGLAYLLIAIIQALVIMGLGNFIFQVSLAGEISTLLLGTLAFITNSVLFGLLIGLRSSNQTAAVQGVSLLGFMTSILLSGFIYPLNNIPFPLSLLPNLIPTRYYISITRDVFIRGIGWRGVWLDFICLIISATILLVISRRVFRKMQQTF